MSLSPRISPRPSLEPRTCPTAGTSRGHQPTHPKARTTTKRMEYSAKYQHLFTRLYHYLDDWLLATGSDSSHIVRPEHVPKPFEMSDLELSQNTEFLGMQLDTVKFMVKPSEDFVQTRRCTTIIICREEPT